MFFYLVSDGSEINQEYTRLKDKGSSGNQAASKTGEKWPFIMLAALVSCAITALYLVYVNFPELTE